jgi:hypothetical protein
MELEILATRELQCDSKSDRMFIRLPEITMYNLYVTNTSGCSDTATTADNGRRYSRCACDHMVRIVSVLTHWLRMAFLTTFISLVHITPGHCQIRRKELFLHLEIIS